MSFKNTFEQKQTAQFGKFESIVFGFFKPIKFDVKEF